MPTRFATNGLARLAYEVSGAEGGPVVALLHATLGERRDLAPLRDALVAVGFRTIVPDARGHGASAALAKQSFTVTDMANDLFTVLDAEKLMRPGRRPVQLVGHGQGALAALELARWRPEHVASLVLIEPELLSVLDEAADPGASAARDEARRANADAADAAYKALGDRAVALYLDRRWGHGWNERLSRPRQAALRRHVGALAGSLPALAEYRLTAAEAMAIRVPTLVVAAETSPAAERCIANRLAEWLPMADLIIVADLPGGAPFRAAGAAAVDRIRAFQTARAG